MLCFPTWYASLFSNVSRVPRSPSSKYTWSLSQELVFSYIVLDIKSSRFHSRVIKPRVAKARATQILKPCRRGEIETTPGDKTRLFMHFIPKRRIDISCELSRKKDGTLARNGYRKISIFRVAQSRLLLRGFVIYKSKEQVKPNKLYRPFARSCILCCSMIKKVSHQHVHIYHCTFMPYNLIPLYVAKCCLFVKP